MRDRKLFDKFLGKCPFAVFTPVATRGAIAEELDQLFEDHRIQQ